jgi:hypothetical protein
VTKSSHVRVRGAQLSILGASTTATYETLWEGQTLDIGFTNRLFLVPGSSGPRRFVIPREIPEEGKQKIVKSLDGVLTLLNKSHRIEVDPKAHKILEDWYLSLERSIHNKRIDTYALRFLILLAINNEKLEVTPEIVESVIQIMQWQLKARQELDPIDADDRVARMEEKIRRVLNNRGPMSERNLKRAVHTERSGLWCFEHAIKNLSKGPAREIFQDKKTKRWKSVTALVPK